MTARNIHGEYPIRIAEAVQDETHNRVQNFGIERPPVLP